MLQHSRPDYSPSESVSLLLDEMEIMFWKKEAAQKEYPDVPLKTEKSSNLILCLYVDNVDSLYERIKSKVSVLMKPKDQSYGIRELTVQDPFGFTWTLAQLKEKK